MKKLTILALLVVLASYSFGKAPWENGKLKVSENGRYLQHENGEPFFWLGDTGWLLFQRLNRDDNITPQIAESFAAHLANYFKDKPNIIWVNGGSTNADNKTEIWETMGATLKKNAPDHLVTFHPFGRMQSSAWFQNSTWLDVNMFVSGHRNYQQDNTTKKYGEDNWRYALDDLSKTPVKPTLDGEPSYEDLPQGLHDPMQNYWTASDVRRYAYWSVFAPSCGHVYGQNTVRQIHIAGVNKAESGAKLSFFEALDAPGSFQMQHIKNLILSRPYFERFADQSVVSGDEGDKYDRIMVTRGNEYLMAYTYTGREFSIQMGKITATTGCWCLAMLRRCLASPEQ